MYFYLRKMSVVYVLKQGRTNTTSKLAFYLLFEIMYMTLLSLSSQKVLDDLITAVDREEVQPDEIIVSFLIMIPRSRDSTVVYLGQWWCGGEGSLRELNTMNSIFLNMWHAS